jgi:pimeloyl-ACP methyl ester carboxylesterase
MTIVLFPGLSGSAAAELAFVGPMLARHGAVTSIDLPAAADFDELVDRVRGARPAGPLTLVGSSIGAAVALSLTATTPEVERLVLVSGLLTGGERERQFASTWAALPVSARRDFERFAAVLGGEGSPSGELAPFDSRLVALLPTVDLEEAADTVTVPTLVVGGTNDAVTGREQATALFGAVEPARLAVIDGGHALLHERPAQVLSLIEAFEADPERHPPGSVVPTEGA